MFYGITCVFKIACLNACSFYLRIWNFLQTFLRFTCWFEETKLQVKLMTRIILWGSSKTFVTNKVGCGYGFQNRRRTWRHTILRQNQIRRDFQFEVVQTAVTCKT